LNPETIRKFDVACSPYEAILYQTHQPIWHAIIAPKLLKTLELEISEDCLKAIKLHTTGGPNMTVFESLVFIADYVEPKRMFSDIGYIRELLENSIDKAVLALSYSSILSLQKRHHPIHYLTRQCFSYYIHQVKDDRDSILNTIKKLNLERA